MGKGRSRPLVRSVDHETHSSDLIGIAACWPIIAPSLILLVSSVVPRLSFLPASPAALLVYGGFAFVLLVSLPSIMRRITPWTGGIACILVLAFSLMVLIDHDHAKHYLAVAATCLLLAVPWMLVANAVTSHAKFLRYLYVSAVVVVIASAVRLYLPGQLAADVAYSQYDGYQALPAAVIFADDFARRPRLRTGFLLAVATTLLLAAGARGPLLALALFIVARAIVALRRRPRAVIALLALGFVVIKWFDQIIPALLGLTSRFFLTRGFSTRAIDRLISGNFLEDRARGALAHFSWDLILTHPVVGVGIARDRLLLADAMGVRDPLMADGWYPHNLPLEIVIQYGVFLGAALLVALAVLVVKSVLDDSDAEETRVVLLFVGIGLFPLLVSGSYLTSPLFFAMMGFCLASRRRAKAAGGQKRRTPVVTR